MGKTQVPGPRQILLADLDALRSIVDAVPHTIFIKDEEGRFVLVNQTMCTLMGHAAETLIGKTDYDFVPKAEADIFRAKDQQVLESGMTNVNEELLSDPAGAVRNIITRKNRLVLSDGSRFIIGCITDITDFRHAEAQIRHNAEHDHLTGLANRSLFQREAERIIAASGGSDHSMALLLIDLDGFKNANDLFGHAVGDELLVLTASFLTQLIGQDDLVARLGGDEFAIIQRQVPQPASAIALAEGALSGLSPMVASGHRVEISASIGIAPLVAVTDYEALLRHADLALYDAKKSGRKTWRVFEPAMEAAHLAARFSRGRSPCRHQAPAVLPGLSAVRRYARSRHTRFRGTSALDPSPARRNSPLAVHPARRAHRKHRGAERIGVARSLRRSGALAGAASALDQHFAHSFHAG
jgi:diguanylate cyclase (GGDEF)-like protein/PAS domain S-box-containing protein